VRIGANYIDKDLPGSVRVRAKGSFGHSCHRKSERFHTPAKEKKETSIMVDALPKDTAQERFRYVKNPI